MRNRRGWIEIVEAFIAILLIASVILIVINKQTANADISEKIYDAQISILREIQTNDSLRADIASVGEGLLPLSWGAEGFPASIVNKIIERTPTYLECAATICVINTPCVLGAVSGSENKNIYSQSVVISSTIGGLVYRQLNIFCWTK